MNRESQTRDVRSAQKQPRAKSMPRQHRRGSDLGVYAPPTIIEPRAQTLHPPDRDYHQKNYLSPPIDDEYLEMQTPNRKHHHHKRKEKGVCTSCVYFFALQQCLFACLARREEDLKCLLRLALSMTY